MSFLSYLSFLALSVLVCQFGHMLRKLFSFFHFFAFCSILRMKHRSDDPIGAPAPLPKRKLPTFADMARQWRQTRIDMQNAVPGTRVSNRAVAKTVKEIEESHFSNITR